MMNNYLQLLNHLENNEEVVFGLLLEKKGSAPQIPGASALFDKKGLLLGTLGGGILEMKAEQLASSLWDKKENHVCEIDYTSDIGEDNGAICGGIASFLLDFNPIESLSIFQALNRDIQSQKGGYLITRIENKNPKIISRKWLTEIDTEPAEFIKVFKPNETTALIKEADALTFVEHLTPPPQLIIIGAGHIGQALCHHGALLDFDVVVIDNRPNYANPALVPDANRLIVETNLKDGIRQLSINKNTYLVIVTQGHKTDCEALECVINSKAAYLGMIGSKRKVQQVKDDFIKRKVCSEKEFNQIHAPIGLNIGSKSVQEIVISIAAELIAVRNKNRG